MTKNCPGCGSTFQCVNPLENGYIKKEIMAKGGYCERCFKIIHYGKTLVVDEPKDIQSIIDIVNKDTKHTIFLMDLFSISLSSIDIYNQINGSKTLVISKSDMFGHIIKTNQVRDLLKYYYDVGENILFVDTNLKRIKELITYLEKNNIKKSYILGFINAGKSTLINNIIKIKNSSITSLTTSYIPHTTMDFITMKISDKLTIIDSPGIAINAHITGDIGILKKLNSKIKLRPLTYQMKKGDTLLIENLVSIYSDIKNSFTLYLNNNLEVKKIYKNILDYNELELIVDDNCDVIIKGIGFINIKKSCTIRVKVKDLDLVEVRSSIFRR